MSNKNKVTETPETLESKLAQAKIDLEIAKAEMKKIKELAKAQKVKKVNEGTPVRFENQASETIEGPGVLYYVVRAGGKLHYKKATSCEVLESLPETEA